MKHIMRLFVSVLLILSFVLPANATELQSNGKEFSYSFYDENGQTVSILTQKSNDTATAKVYVEGILTQKSVAYLQAKRIETEIYDINVSSPKTINPKIGSMNGFQTVDVHLPISNERIDVAEVNAETRSIYNEPVDNAGLSTSVYGDGYYYLGSAGNLSYAPNITGGLYRQYSRTYDGETKYWSWDAGDTMSAIVAYITGLSGPVNAIIRVLVFTGKQVLAYYQAVELATYTYHYNYRVRVYGAIHFTAQRNKTYWEIYNSTTNESDMELKSFNYGFTQDNYEMIICGIDRYLVSIQ